MDTEMSNKKVFAKEGSIANLASVLGGLAVKDAVSVETFS
jgi:hypothetical protein